MERDNKVRHHLNLSTGNENEKGGGCHFISFLFFCLFLQWVVTISIQLQRHERDKQINTRGETPLYTYTEYTESQTDVEN